MKTKWIEWLTMRGPRRRSAASGSPLNPTDYLLARLIRRVLLPLLVAMLLASGSDALAAAAGAAGSFPTVQATPEGPAIHSEAGRPLESGASSQGIASNHGDASESDHSAHYVPSLFSIIPFVLLLLMIAVMPLIPGFHHWWENNWNRLLVALTLGGLTCIYYGLRPHGFHHAAAGLPSVLQVLDHAIIVDYIPFIVLLFSLYTISGGIYIGGDIPARPSTNVALLFIGAMLASFIGTTGASMLLIRPLLQINSERAHVRHSVIFFIFLVSNVGGCLLPIGDPPLFLGYLRGVPFLWTVGLAKQWLFCVVLLLIVYWAIDHFWYHPKESVRSLQKDESQIRPFRILGTANLFLLVCVILSVGLLVPGNPLPGTSWTIPDIHLREIALLSLAGISLLITSKDVRKANAFSFYAIGEVAALFIGIFVTMQAPVEILNIKGPELGLRTPAQFFWATGLLSSVLDNAPTYVVFFQTAGTLPASGQEMLTGVATATGEIGRGLLVAISLGSVFMGACTYIGNGPNFMVKSIAENYNVKMPSFFGYMGYSAAILFPLFLLVTWLFLT